MGPTSPCLVDTSVLINLLATENPVDILRISGVDLLVPSRVAREVIRCPRTGGSDVPLQRLLSTEFASQVDVSCNPEPLKCFIALAAGSYGRSLDDGESAALALAAYLDYPLLIDEQTGRSVCGEHFSRLRLSRSVELFREVWNSNEMDRQDAKQALFDALRFGHMHVPKNSKSMEWVRQVLSPKDLACCPSIP